MNVHKRCQKNVANNCGINTKQMAEILNQMGISPDKQVPRRSKYLNQSCSTGSSGDGLSTIGGSDSSSGGGSVGSAIGSGDHGGESAEEISMRLAAQKIMESKMQDNGMHIHISIAYLFILWKYYTEKTCYISLF